MHFRTEVMGDTNPLEFLYRLFQIPEVAHDRFFHLILESYKQWPTIALIPSLTTVCTSCQYHPPPLSSYIHILSDP